MLIGLVVMPGMGLFVRVSGFAGFLAVTGICGWVASLQMRDIREAPLRSAEFRVQVERDLRDGRCEGRRRGVETAFVLQETEPNEISWNAAVAVVEGNRFLVMRWTDEDIPALVEIVRAPHTGVRFLATSGGPVTAAGSLTFDVDEIDVGDEIIAAIYDWDLTPMWLNGYSDLFEDPFEELS